MFECVTRRWILTSPFYGLIVLVLIVLPLKFRESSNLMLLPPRGEIPHFTMEIVVKSTTD